MTELMLLPYGQMFVEALFGSRGKGGELALPEVQSHDAQSSNQARRDRMEERIFGSDWIEVTYQLVEQNAS
jgi:hypothetical protein